MKVAKKSDLVIVVRTYTDKEGKEKKVWKSIGELTTFQDDDGTFFSKVELYHMPGVSVSVFEQKPREQEQEEKTPF